MQEENEELRRQLTESGIEIRLPSADAAGSTGTEQASTAGGASSAFDAEKAPPEKVAEIGFPPASLDPDEVLASLPQSMQAAFDALDVQALHAALAALPPAEASEYMRRCVASGLWDPNGAGGDA